MSLPKEIVMSLRLAVGCCCRRNHLLRIISAKQHSLVEGKEAYCIVTEESHRQSGVNLSVSQV